MEQIAGETAAGESERLTSSRVQNSDFSAAIANVLAAAGAGPQPVAGGVSYGKRSVEDALFRADMESFRNKRSAQSAAEDVEVIDEAAVASSDDTERLRDANFNAALANVLAVAGATPRAVSGGVSYGKRSAQTTAEDVYVERSLRPGRAPQDLDGPEQEAELKDPEAHPSGVPASVIAQVLKAAGAKPQPVVKGDIS